MNNSLDRLIEGIIATLRNDVIPNVTDAYARGQAVGVIDLLNNLAPRLDWARAPLDAAVATRRAALAEGLAALGEPAPAATTPLLSPAELMAERDRLDRAICALMDRLMADAALAPALNRLRAHLHADLKDDLRLTRRPLFAEIARGAGPDGADG